MTADLRVLCLSCALGLSMALPADAASFVVTDVTGPAGKTMAASEGGPRTLTVPRVEVVDANVDEAVIRSIFFAGPPAQAEALANLDAASVTIPEIRVAGTAPEGVAGATAPGAMFSNMVLSDVTDGVAGTVSIGGITTTDEKGGEVAIGAVEMRDVHIRTLLQLNDALAGAPELPAALFSGMSIAGAKITSPEGTCTIGDYQIGTVAARKLRTMPIGQGFELASKVDEQEKPAAADVDKVARFYADLLTAYESGESTLAGLSCDVTEEGKPVAIRMGAISVGAKSGGQLPLMSFQGLSIKMLDGVLDLGELVIKPTDATAAIQLIESTQGVIDTAWLEANQRRLIAGFEGFSLSGLSMDLPNTEQPTQRIKADVGAVDLTLGAYENAIPTDVSFTVNAVKATLPADSPEMQPLIQMGYGELNVDFDFKARWDRDTRTIIVDQLLLRAADAGTISISAVIGNAVPELFAADPNAMTQAATGLTVKELRITVDDAGAVPKIFTAVAAAQSADEGAFRAGIAAMAQGMVIVGLGATPQAMQVSQAITEFVQGGAQHLSLTARATNETGITMADFAAAEQDPTVLLRMLEVTAESAAAPAEQPAAPAASGDKNTSRS